MVKVFGKIFGILVRAIIILCGIILLVSALLYIPVVQDFAKSRIASAVSSATGMRLDIGRFRLRFPLAVALYNTSLSQPGGDTLVRFGEFRARVAAVPLIMRGNIRTREVSLSDAAVNYSDTTMTIKAEAGSLLVRRLRMNPKEKSFTVGRISLDGVGFDMGGSTGFSLLLPSGEISGLALDLAAQDIKAQSAKLEKASIALTLDTVQTVQDTLPALPWTVNVEKVELEDNSFAYDGLSLKGINLTAEALYNRNTDVSADISTLALREGLGVEITDGSGDFSMDSTGVVLHDFKLHTPESSLNAELTAGAGIMSLEPSTPVSLRLSAGLSPGEIFRFITVPEDVKKILLDKTFTVDAETEGTLGSLDIHRLALSMPRHIALSASGKLVSALDVADMKFDVKFDAGFTDMDFVKALFPDSLASRTAIPARINIAGAAALASGAYSADMRLKVDTMGQMTVGGSFDPRLKNYRAEVAAQDFPLYKFLPGEGLGYISFDLDAAGSGFDMTSDEASAQANLYISGLDLNSFYYDGIEARASLKEHLVEGYIFGRNDALDIDMDISGEVRKGYYAARLYGSVAMLDFQAMNLSQSPLALSLMADASVSAIPDSLIYTAHMLLDTVRVAHGNKLEKIDRTTINAVADRTHIDAEVFSDDFTLDFTSPVPLASLLESFATIADTVQAQVRERDMDMARIQPLIPTLNLKARAGRYNVLGSLLRDRGYGFDSLTVTAANSPVAPLDAAVMMGGFRSSSFRTDTLRMGLGIDGNALTFGFKMANRPSRAQTMALIGIEGRVEHNTARIDLYQRDSRGNTGFAFGFDGRLRDSSITVSMFPENPVFGYEKWSLNPGNYFEYAFDRRLFADMRFEGAGKHFYLQPASKDSLRQGGINLDAQGIVLHDIFRMLPYPPPVDGVFSSEMDFYMVDSLMSVNGRAGISGLTYDRRKVGDISADVDFGYGADSILRLDASATLDKNTAFTANGTYTANDMNLKITAPSLPLAVVNAFIPKGTATLGGTLQGELEISGNKSAPAINGSVGFVNGTVKTDMTGTSFKISPTRVKIAHNVVDFDNFALTAPNNRPLSLDGTVDISNFSRMYADLNLFATNFEVINSARNGGSPVYGRALADVDITARGAVYNLSVRGDVRLLSATDIVYTMQESSTGIEDRKQDLVTFISFADADEMAALADTTLTVASGGMDMVVGIDIDDGVKAAVNLSANGNNRIELVGGGNLSYSIDSHGDARMAGRYSLAGGTVVYSPPMMSRKDFNIDGGSYVEWAGDAADPSFNISAAESVRTTVTMDDGTTSSVDFDILVKIQNTLNNMALAFDLAAPGDLTIQNQLTALAPEQRSQQALGLLVYNTYTGPGTSAKADANNPLNSFLEKELNQWTRNNLRNVDLSFGIASRESATGAAYTDYSYKVSKSLFDDRVKVTVGGSLSSETDASANARENFVDDISLEYRLSARDNMFAKAYRYNTRESILEGEVTETGVGFLARKKINRLGDLFRITRERERQRIRREEEETEKEDTDESAD